MQCECRNSSNCFTTRELAWRGGEISCFPFAFAEGPVSPKVGARTFKVTVPAAGVDAICSGRSPASGDQWDISTLIG